MVKREFLGWQHPFSSNVTEWLAARRDELPSMLLVVPTAQSGRRLREALAEATGAVLSPRVVTPGSFLQSRDDEAAPDWVEQVAWNEVLDGVSDWSGMEALFPEPPDAASDWATGMAREMVTLRHALQENGLTLDTAARKLTNSPEADRWQALAALEEQVETKLRTWKITSRSRLLAGGLTAPPGVTSVVLAGVTELPPLVDRALRSWPVTVTTLIAAPEDEAGNFSEIGIPLESWASRALPTPEGSLQVVADPRQQALEALRIVGEAGTSSDGIVLGAADSETGDELARAFSRAGWLAFHPAAANVASGLARWFRVWRSWLTDPTLACLGDLLGLPETGILVGGKRAQKARRLAQLRDEWMVVRGEDLQRRVEKEAFRSDADQKSAIELLEAVRLLERWRTSLLAENFSGSLGTLLEILGKTGDASRETAEAMAAWLTEAAPLMHRVKRGAGFWIDLMVSSQSSPAPLPPPGRVLDVQGWLELLHEPGRHLVLCGMNEGKVPARSGGEPWLGEAGRTILGLTRDADRAARDAFIYQALLEPRRAGGRVDVLCGKAGAGGEPLLPSRLLLATDRSGLPERVRLLFRDVEPPEAGMAWTADWKWQPAVGQPKQRISVTSLRDYLACPFRYHLKHVLKFQSPDAERAEWNARDFGTVAHAVLENWGRDTTARELEDPDKLHNWLSAELNREVDARFGKRVPLAVRIQTEALRQRLLWFARVQAEIRAEGWEIVDVERKVELEVEGATVVAMIDRIDRQRETGQLRVIDYKTGKVDSVDKAHRKKLGQNSNLPEHLSLEGPAVYQGEDNGKSADFLWLNLQLPLYAQAVVLRGEALPAPCYITLGTTEEKVKLLEWTKFETADLDAAVECTDWIVGQISAGIFWPPAEKLTYDDFAVLAAGRTLPEMVEQAPRNC